MAEEKYFLDVNIVMYAAGAEHPLKAPCTAVLQMAVDGQIDIVIDAEIIQEALHRYGALRRWETAQTITKSLFAWHRLCCLLERKRCGGHSNSLRAMLR